MMRSLFSGVSGLQNHQTRMDVVGNNISNVNTFGYKRGRVTFQDLISQTQRGAAQPTERRGGVNPQQIGLGMQIAAVDVIHTQGSLQTTGVRDDLAIQGNGFFVVGDGDVQLFTRDGTFGRDRDNILVDPATGLRVQGWTAELAGGQWIVNANGPVGDIEIPVGTKEPAFATTEVLMASNLNKTTPVLGDDATAAEVAEGTWLASIDVFDYFGTTHDLEISWTRSDAAPNQWIATITMTANDGTEIIPDLGVGGVPNAAGDNTLIVQFDNDGVLESISNAAGGTDTEGGLTVDVSYLVPESAIPADVDPDDVDPRFVGAPGDPVTQTFALNFGTVGSVTNSTTQFASANTNRVTQQNGYGMGYLENYRFDQSGVITGVFSNGVNRPIGQVAMATFNNEAGLERVGENAFRQSINSGIADIAVPLSQGKGSIIAGALEMSNVDLAEQFVDMIVTQRGFQANSRTIQTSDQMLQEVLTLKR